MSRYKKCGKCGSPNREHDDKCYSCKADLSEPSEKAVEIKNEIADVGKMNLSVAFYGKVFVLFLAALICRPYFTKSHVYGVFEWAILPFHEAGHHVLFFAPRVVMVAGGTVVQLALPLGFVVYFALKRKEYFSATVPMLWFFGSMQAMAVYMKDARFLLLPLFGADPTEGHDWNYLFGKMHLLHESVAIGNFFHGLAKVGIAVTLMAMLYLLYTDPGRPGQKKQAGGREDGAK